MLHVDSYDGLCSRMNGPDRSFDSVSSDNSSLNSSILDARNPNLYLRSESLESLEEMDTSISDAEFMVYKNTRDLCDDMRFILGMPDMCDVTFVVGPEKTELYGVKAILATRSREFYQLFIGEQAKQAEVSKMNCTKSKSFFKKPTRLLSKLKKLGKRTGPAGVDMSFSRLSQSGRVTMRITDYDVDTFRKLLLYLHCGHISVGVDSVIGLLNAADQFNVPDLHKACVDFTQKCLSLRTILPILASTEHYLRKRPTQRVLGPIFDFVDNHAEDILKLNLFEYVPKHTVRLVLMRRSLQTRETTKLDAAMRWSTRYFAQRDYNEFRKAMRAFVSNMRLDEIPPGRLMREIQPMNIVPEAVLNHAIGNRADRRVHVIGQECEASLYQNRHRPSMGVKVTAMRAPTIGCATPLTNSGASNKSCESSSDCDSDSGFASSDSSSV